MQLAGSSISSSNALSSLPVKHSNWCTIIRYVWEGAVLGMSLQVRRASSPPYLRTNPCILSSFTQPKTKRHRSWSSASHTSFKTVTTPAAHSRRYPQHQISPSAHSMCATLCLSHLQFWRRKNAPSLDISRQRTWQYNWRWLNSVNTPTAVYAFYLIPPALCSTHSRQPYQWTSHCEEVERKKHVNLQIHKFIHGSKADD